MLVWVSNISRRGCLARLDVHTEIVFVTTIRNYYCIDVIKSIKISKIRHEEMMRTASYQQ